MAEAGERISTGFAGVYHQTVDAVPGNFMPAHGGVRYLGDDIGFLRHLEIGGDLRKAVEILQERMSDLERSLWEFTNTPPGIEIGDPLDTLRDVLSGTSAFTNGHERVEPRGGWS